MNKTQLILQQTSYLIAIAALLPSILRGSKSSLYAAFLIEIAFVDTLMDQFVLVPSRFIDAGYFPLLKGYVELLFGSFLFSDAVAYFRQR